MQNTKQMNENEDIDGSSASGKGGNALTDPDTREGTATEVPRDDEGPSDGENGSVGGAMDEPGAAVRPEATPDGAGGESEHRERANMPGMAKTGAVTTADNDNLSGTMGQLPATKEGNAPTSTAATPDATDTASQQGAGEGPRLKRKMPTNGPNGSDEGKKGKKKAKGSKRAQKANALAAILQEIEGELTQTDTAIRSLDLEIQDANDSVRAAKQDAAEMRKQTQLLPLPLMQIDGKNANGGGMSRPGTGDYEFAMSSQSKILADDEYDDPRHGVPLTDSEDDDRALVGAKRKGIDLPSSDSCPPAKSKRTALHSAPGKVVPITLGETPLLSKPGKACKPTRQYKQSNARGLSATHRSESPLQAPLSTHHSTVPPIPTSQFTSPPTPSSIQAPSAQQAAHAGRFCGVWPPPSNHRPGPVLRPNKPSWWSSVKREEESPPGWLQTYQFCKRCGDGGTSLPKVPCVRCASCRLIYCVSEINGRPEHKGCIDVPSFAMEWLCPICVKDCAAKVITDEQILTMAGSQMNMNYTVRHAELSGPPSIPRTPLLILEIQCLADEPRKPFSVASQFMTLITHAYGQYAHAQLLHCVWEVRSLACPDIHLQNKAVAFLQDWGRCNVLITVDAHTFGGDGTINYFGTLSSPLTVLLWHVLGSKLWTAISQASGRRLMIPLVCGWIWKFANQVQWVSALFKDWDLQCGEGVRATTTSIPPLITNLLGFSTTTLVTWTIASQITGVLRYLLLGEDDFLKQVKHHLLTNRSLMDSTSIVIGYISSNKVHLQQATRKDANLNFFGLPPPLRCGACSSSVIVRYHDVHVDKKNPKPDRVLALCRSCGVSTHEYTAPTSVRCNVPDIFFWNLPLTEHQWEWAERDAKEVKLLEDTKP